jgi:hypothetical protein
MRGRTNTDPASRAASIQAARQAFEEKEAAKTRKAEKQQLKALDREARKKEKLEWRRSVGSADTREKSRHDASPGRDKTDSIRGIDYGTLPKETKPEPDEPVRKPGKPHGPKDAKSTWMLFLTWLRTRIFKLRRKVSHH